jgi:ligand-binding sensor domain-containing protein
VDPRGGAAWVLDVAALHRIDPASGDWEHRGQGNGLDSSNLTRVAAFAGEVAIASSDRGLYLLRGGKLRAFDDQAGLADNWITDLAFDASGKLWLATCTRGVSVRDARGRFQRLTERDGLADDYVLSVQEIAGRIFIGTLRGLSILSGSQIVNLGIEQGLSGSEVHDAVLYAGEVWVATDGGLSVLAMPDAAPAR